MSKGREGEKREGKGSALIRMPSNWMWLSGPRPILITEFVFKKSKRRYKVVDNQRMVDPWGGRR
jgi:hypothetical protein